MGRAFLRDMARRFLLALSLVSCYMPLQGATLERLTLDDMIEKATAIVRGRITGSYAEARGNVVYTRYQMRVEERWKGPEQPAVEFLVPGGTAGRLRQTYSGSPKLVEGKDYLIFLWTSPRTRSNFVLGFTQGLFNLPKDAGGAAMAVREPTAEIMLEPGTGRVVRDERIEMRLRDMSARISNSLARGARK